MNHKKSTLSPRARAQAALLRVNSVPVARQAAPAVDSQAVEAAQDQARADRLKAAAAKHVENAKILDEVMENMSDREQREVTRRAMLNPKWSPIDLDSIARGTGKLGGQP